MGTRIGSCGNAGALRYLATDLSEQVIQRAMTKFRPFDLQIGDVIYVPSMVTLWGGVSDSEYRKGGPKLFKVTAIYPRFFMGETIGNHYAEYKESFLIMDYRLGWIKKYER